MLVFKFFSYAAVGDRRGVECDCIWIVCFESEVEYGGKGVGYVLIFCLWLVG